MDALTTLTKQYTEPHRRYHTLEHIAYMFNTAKAHGIELSSAQVQAIWWHDAVYTPGSPINEGDSIAMMSKFVKDNDAFIKAVDVIWDTAKHEPRTEESAVVCDLDMFVFADSFNVHYRYTQQLYEEFVQFVPRLEFFAKRVEFLEHLKTTPIFHSAHFKSYRLKAIHAIDKELHDLRLLLAISSKPEK